MLSRTSRKFIVVSGVVMLGAAWFVYQYLPRHQGTALIGFLQDAPALSDSTLVRSDQDERVYYMEGNKRRWITSPDVLRAQGFRVEDIQIMPGGDVDRYQEGEPISLHSLVILPGERGLLPDIAPLAPYQLRLAKVNGRMAIKFTGSFWNRGGQSFSLIPETSHVPTNEEQAPVYERITAADGSVRMKLIDNFIYHPAHHHLHLVDFGYYILTLVRSTSGTSIAGIPFIRNKTTFCMRDDERMPSDLPGIPTRPVFTACGIQGQGVSVGWIDVYPSTLPDQYVDVEDMPAGVYSLSFMLDPQQHYLEERKDNNIGTTLLELDVKKRILNVIALAAPFPNDRNSLPDGLLVRAGGDDKIYVMSKGTKRWLRTPEVFASYGYRDDNVYILAHGIIEAIPDTRVIELAGTTDIYRVNDQGYKHHILTPEEFHAAGFREAEVVPVSQTEFDSYPNL